MKRTILNCAVFAILIFSTALMSSCDREPTSGNSELTITAIVENGNEFNEIITQVKATSLLSITDGQVERAVHATNIFADGGFSITLPRTI